MKKQEIKENQDKTTVEIERLLEKGKITRNKFEYLVNKNRYTQDQLDQLESIVMTTEENFQRLMELNYITQKQYDFYEERYGFNKEQLEQLKTHIFTKEQIKEYNLTQRIKKFKDTPLPKDKMFNTFIESIDVDKKLVLLFEGYEERRIFERIIYDDQVAVGHTDGTSGSYIYHSLKKASELDIPVVFIVDNDEGGDGIIGLYKRINKYFGYKAKILKINELLNHDYKDFEDYLIDIGMLPKVYENFFIKKSDIKVEEYLHDLVINDETKYQMIDGARSLLKFNSDNKRMLKLFNELFEKLEAAVRKNKEKLSPTVPLSTFKDFYYAIYGNHITAIRIVKWNQYQYINLNEMRKTLYYKRLKEVIEENSVIFDPNDIFPEFDPDLF